MDFDNDTRQAMTQNWPQIREQLKQQFPNLSEQDLSQGQNDPEALVSSLVQSTGQDEHTVRQSIQRIVSQPR